MELEVQSITFWQVLWRTNERMARNHLPYKQRSREEDEKGLWGCLLIHQAWSFLTLSSSPHYLSPSQPSDHHPSLVWASTSTLSYSPNISTHIFLYGNHITPIYNFLRSWNLSPTKVLKKVIHKSSTKTPSFRFILLENGPCPRKLHPRRLNYCG
jgi:hypothetical protein